MTFILLKGGVADFEVKEKDISKIYPQVWVRNPDPSTELPKIRSNDTPDILKKPFQCVRSKSISKCSEAHFFLVSRLPSGRFRLLKLKLG